MATVLEPPRRLDQRQHADLHQILELDGGRHAPNRFRRIEGVADTDPFNPTDRLDPRNRRISITLMTHEPLPLPPH
ncbi:hypothetical protein [Polymorphobacter arshaanensis]|uniref:hypothetical protein n=1 Tax=Glacieibacterium arshaanense TaxID=2511025 RepID=UPI001FB0CF83|nr:hypothetical protein [Polymorphobacter arshaanensis]